MCSDCGEIIVLKVADRTPKICPHCGDYFIESLESLVTKDEDTFLPKLKDKP